MAGRHATPRVSPRRESVLDRLRSDLSRFAEASAREQFEQERGGPMARDTAE